MLKMTKLETAKAEIRAIFANEVYCFDEVEGRPERSTLVIFTRTVRLAGMNAAEGKTCVSTITYAIHRDGYWEQMGAYNGPWEAPAREARNCVSVPAGWQSADAEGALFGPAFNDIGDLWQWQRHYAGRCN